MKFFLWLIVIAGCALGYIYQEQPQLWNAGLAAFRAPASSTAADPISASAPAPVSTSEGVPINASGATATSSASQATPNPADKPSMPSTITTNSGKTYTECVLSRVTPDGISFMHSTGVAKVLFTDLDPAFAAKFGYDPVAAQKYEEEQAIQARASDERRKVAAAMPTRSSAVTANSIPVERPVLSPGEKASIQARIDALQSDINFMEREENKVTVVTLSGQVFHDVGVTHGAYAEKITAEQAQIAELQKQLQ